MKRVQTHREGVFGEGATECPGKEAVFLAATSGYLDETPEKEQKRGRFWKGEKGNARSVVSMVEAGLIGMDWRRLNVRDVNPVLVSLRE
mgnify:CR=1 FL=1